MHTSVNSDMLVGLRLLVLREESNGWQELAGRIFGVDTIFDGVTVDFYVVLCELKLMSG